MAIVKKLQKFGRLPTSLIINGGDFLGVSLAESLLEQSSKVIVIDDFTDENQKRLKHLMESDLFTFGDFSLLENLSNSNTRIDYVFFLNYDLAYREEKIDTQYFMRETKKLDRAVKLGVKKNVKFLYAASMEIDRYLTSMTSHGELGFGRSYEEISYTTLELQRYSENLVMEYHKKSALNARIIRLGEVYGEGMEFDRRTELVRLLNSAVKERKISIFGEGLQTRYYLHVLDATYGLIKAQFGNNTNGEIFSLANPEEVSELSLAYKILEFNPTADEVEFKEVDRRIYPSRVSISAENLSVIGWTPHIDFEKGLFKTLSYFYKAHKLNWKNPPKDAAFAQKESEHERVAAETASAGSYSSYGQTQLESSDGEISTPDNLDPQYAEQGNMLADKTKRIVEISEGGEGEERVVRVLPIGEDRAVRKNLMDRMVFIPKTVKDPDIMKWIVFGAFFIPFFILVLFPILRVGVFGLAGSVTGLVGLRQAQQSNYAGAATTLGLSNDFYRRGSDALSYFKAPSEWVGADGAYQQSTYIMSMLEHFAAAGEHASKGLKPWIKYAEEFEPLVNPNNPDVGSAGSTLSYQATIEEMSDSSTDLSIAASELREAKNAYQSINTEYFPGFVQDAFERVGTKLNTLSTDVDKAVKMVEYVPDLLGKDERKNYLVLFQNPYEARSTGGWIGGYALVGIEEGQLRKLVVDDIYNADGKLQVENRLIAPPTDMKEALDIRQWTLSLSNWNPDFQMAARDAEYLSRDILETPEIDGVITVDTYVMRDLIGVIGEVDSGGDEGIVSADNFFDIVLNLREGFEPGSDKKSDFLGRIGEKILNSTLRLSRSEWPGLAEIIMKNLDEKHILLSFDNPAAGRAISENGWSGGLLSGDVCDAYYYPVDYNWSGNKVNAYVSRTSNLSLAIDEWSPANASGKIIARGSIAYKNSSTNSTFEGGNYNNYLRVYLPSDSKIENIKGLRQGSLKIYAESGKTVLAGWVDVEAGESEIVTFDYSFDWVEIDTNKASNPDLSICMQKQPGYRDENVTIKLTDTAGLSPKEIDVLTKEGSEYQYFGVVKDDLVLNVGF